MTPLPEWLVLGVAIAAGLTVVFAAVFVVGERLFPSPPFDATGPDPGEGRRRREIRAYLDALGEQYVEDAEVRDQRVAFYLPERDVAITFDPQAYFRLDATRTNAVLVEHEMPGAHLGARLPFETPEAAVGEGDSPTDDPVATAFATLGLPPDASRAEVRRAYRERVKEVHPDHGGDEERFRRVREAYTAAKEHAHTS